MSTTTFTKTPVPAKLQSLAASFGPTMEQVVEAAVARGVNPDEIHEFVSQFKPLLDQPAAKPSASPAAQPMTTATAPSGSAKPEVSAQSAAPAGLPPLSSLDPVPITPPTVTQFTFWQKGVLHAVLETPPAQILLYALNRAAALSPVLEATIGIGGALSGGAMVGGSAGAGLVVSYDGTIAYYGSLGLMYGWFASISVGVTVTIVSGGIESFTSFTQAATIAGGDGLVGSFSVLLHADPLSFEGISVFVGAGGGIPLEIYMQTQYAWASKGVQGNDVLGIGQDNNLWVLSGLGANNWVSPAGHTNDKLIGIALALNGTLLGVGTDNQLYSAPSLESPFTLAPVASPNVLILSIAVLKDGMLLGVGQADGLLYTRGSLDSSTPWRKLPQENTMAVTFAVCLPTGAIVGIGKSDGQLYTRASTSAAWKSTPTNATKMISIAQFPGGKGVSLIGITTAGVLMQCPGPGSTWQSLGNTGSNEKMLAICVPVDFVTSS